MLGQGGEQHWEHTNSNLLLQCCCWCPTKADAAAEVLEEIPRKKLKPFILVQLEHEGSGYKITLKWHRAIGLAVESMC